LSQHLAICTFLPSDTLAADIIDKLSGERYAVERFPTETEFLEFVENQKHRIDCLILQSTSSLSLVTQHLRDRATFLPAVVLTTTQTPLVDSEYSENWELPNNRSATLEKRSQFSSTSCTNTHYFYHSGEVVTTIEQVDLLESGIENAIAQFLKRSPQSFPSDGNGDTEMVVDAEEGYHFVVTHQHRLAEKLKERLGYLGVYYKRNPDNFFRHLSHSEQKKFLEELEYRYREIIINYFAGDDRTVNTKIDEFVNLAFFSDISATQIVELHMNLMDEFSKQLQLEGRSEEILLDYRLTLIDTISHLCEMYRRSIPRESS
jgi:circadian clock protein KaiA